MVEHLLLSAFRGAAVFLGTLIAFLGFLVFRRYRSRLMLYISVGFGILTLGAVLEGILFEVFALPLDQAHLVESSVTLAALLTLAYSLNLRRGGG